MFEGIRERYQVDYVAFICGKWLTEYKRFYTLGDARDWVKGIDISRMKIVRKPYRI